MRRVRASPPRAPAFVTCRHVPTRDWLACGFLFKDEYYRTNLHCLVAQVRASSRQTHSYTKTCSPWKATERTWCRSALTAHNPCARRTLLPRSARSSTLAPSSDFADVSASHKYPADTGP